MRRAIHLLAFALLALGLSPGDAPADAQPVNVVNGIGMIDYSRKPDWKIGDWVQYHITGSSEMGMTDDYKVTVLIAGEERFWGEDCFWVESVTELKGVEGATVATLMSYSIFGDSLALLRLQMYSRKTINETDEAGNVIPILVKRTGGSFKNREAIGRRGMRLKVDTLGTETVTVDKGTFSCKRVKLEQGVGATTDVGDSTLRTEVREERLVFVNPKIPITSVVREEILNSIVRKTWRVGHSEGSTFNVMDEGRGAAVLVDYGSGRVATLVPAAFRKPFRLQQAGGATKSATGVKSRKSG